MNKPFVRYVLSQKLEIADGREEWYDIHSDIHKDSVISYAKKLKNKNSNIILGLREIVETEIEI